MADVLRADILFLLLAAPCVGSFLSVVADRLPRSAPIVRGRSRCAHCGNALGWTDLVPVLSWLSSRGCCRHCGGRIAVVHPALELGAFVVALWAALVTPGWLAWASSGLGWALLALAVIDWRDGILPHEITWPLIVAGLGVAAAADPAGLLPHAIGAGAGAGVVLALRAGYAWARGREGIGVGDAWLLAAGGAWVGWEGLASVVLIAAAAGLAHALLARRGRLDVRDSVAFGPFIAAAVWLVWLYGPIRFGIG